MAIPEKACPVVYRSTNGALDVLAFHHPLAGNQFVKGTIECGERPADAASRELREESGIVSMSEPRYLGNVPIGHPPIIWHLYAWQIDNLPQKWNFATKDDYGHVFSFFWHPLENELDRRWHHIFHEVFYFMRSALIK